MSVTPLPRGEDDQRERPPRRPPQPAPGRAPSLLDSFNYAFEGIIHVLRTQRNLRIHVLVAILVFAAAVALGVSRLQLIALVLAIAFVHFGHQDVVRHKLVQRIVEAYKRHSEQTGTQRSR